MDFSIHPFNHDFEEPLIAGFLPLVEALHNINTPLGAAETSRLLLTLLGRPLPCQVVAVSSPLATVLVPRIGHPHGTPLAQWPPPRSPPASTPLLTLPPPPPPSPTPSD